MGGGKKESIPPRRESFSIIRKEKSFTAEKKDTTGGLPCSLSIGTVGGNAS